MQSPMKAWSNVCAGWETVDSNKKNAKNKKKNNDSMENDEKLQKNKKHSKNDSKGNDPSKMKSVVDSKTEIVENDSPVFLSFGDFDSVIVEEFSSCVESESTSLSTTPPRVPACTTTNESDNIMSGMTETEISEDKVDGTIAPATLNSVYPCTKELFRDISLSFIEKMSASVKLNNSGEINTESEAESSMEASKLEGSELNIVDIRMNSRGFINGATACFRNAVLQALFTLPPFMRVTCSLIDELFTYKKRAPQDSSSNATLDENISYDLSEALPMWHSVLLFINSVRTNPAVTEHLRHSSKSRDERASPDVATATTNKSDMALLGKGHAKGKRKNKPNKEKATTLLSNTILSNASHVVGSHAHSATCVAPDEYLGDLIRRFRLIMSPSSNSPQNAFLFTPTNKQEDAMEFLTFLLDVLHEEALLHVTSELGTETIRDLDRKEKEIVDENAAEDSEEGWTEVRKCGTGSSAKVSGIKVVIDEATRLSTTREVASSLVGQLFHGILRSEVVYSRKHMSSVTFQKFHCLTLNVDRISIPHSDDQKKLTKRPVTPHYLQYTNSSRPNGVGYNQPCKLEDAFLNYFKEEKITASDSEGSFIITKKLSFDSIPKVLILQLNRYEFDHEKNVSIKLARPVIYPHIFNIPKSCVSPEALSGRSRTVSGAIPYELTAVICHLGNDTTRGHYTAVCKDVSTGQWRSYNDTKIMNISEEEALLAASVAYVLFYTDTSI